LLFSLSFLASWGANRRLFFPWFLLMVLNWEKPGDFQQTRDEVRSKIEIFFLSLLTRERERKKLLTVYVSGKNAKTY